MTRGGSTTAFGRPARRGVGQPAAPAGYGVRRRLAHPVAAVGALLALCLLAALGATSDSAHATFPGQNGRIVCSGERATAVPPPAPNPALPPFSRQEVFSMNPDGSDLRVLTANAFSDFDATVSPDATTIAFESYASGDSEIYTMKTDGTDVRRRTFQPSEDRPGSYSPDGRQITFHGSPPSPPEGRLQFQVMRMNADGSNPTNVTPNRPEQNSNPAWSPAGTKIAFHSARDGGDLEIYTINPDGSAPTRITTSPGIDAFPQWSPDGRQITFRSNRHGNAEIYRMNADGTGVTRLTTNATNDPATPTFNEADDDVPIWSPDGTQILFDSQRSGDREVYTMNAADGSGVTRLTTNPNFDGRCDWGRVPGVRLAATACPTARVGTEAGETLNGTPGGDRMFGLGGRDIMNGVQGNDCLFGGEDRDSLAGASGRDLLQGDAANDTLKGGSSADRLSGGSGRDRVLGDAGNDRLYGGSGNDSIDGGRGANRYSGGSGNDRINAANGRRERVNCGSGRRDVVRADRSDRLRGCEQGRVR